MNSFVRRLPQFHVVALAASLFVIAIGGRWLVLDRFGSDLPVWDQWDAEGLQLLSPWFAKDRFLSHLFEPQNEHRIVVTKLQNLALTLAAGQWDARLQCAANAALAAGFAVALWLLARRWTPPASHPGLFVIIAALFALPFAWHNIIGGLHSAQHWLLWSALLCLWLLPFARPWSKSWFVGALAAIAGLFTLGSGAIAAALVVGLLGLRWWQGHATLRTVWPALAVAAAAVVAGVLTRVEVSYHAQLKATTLAEFLLSMARGLQWPDASPRAWLVAGFLWLPWLLVTARAFRRVNPESDRIAQTIAVIGGWIVLQLLATAYARGAGAGYPAPRYMDTLAFGTATNAIALAWLFSAASRRWPTFAVWTLFAGGWLAVVGFGLHRLTKSAWNDALPASHRYVKAAEFNARLYLATGDRTALASSDIPYPGADNFIHRVSRPGIAPLLPASIRPGLPLLTANPGHSGFELIPAGSTPPRLLPSGHPRLPWVTCSSLPADAGTSGTGDWHSAPISAVLSGWLEFYIAGSPGEAGLSLELRDAKTGAVLRTIALPASAALSWRPFHTQAPRQPFVIAARDSSPDTGFAFSAPVEMSTLSYWAMRGCQSALVLIVIGAGAAFVVGACSAASHLRDRRSRRAAALSTPETGVAESSPSR